MIAALFFAGIGWASLAHAESMVWNSGNIPEIRGHSVLKGPRDSWYRLYNTTVSVTYEAGAYEVGPSNNVIAPIACGTTVPVGTRVGFIFRPHVYTDISWFTTGFGFDSPYGSWSKDFSPCQANGQYVFQTQRGKTVSNYLVVNPPAKETSGISGTCTGTGSDRFCTLDQPGTFVASMTFRPTTGKFYAYEHYSGCREQNVLYDLQVPQQTASCQITVEDDETGPPTLTASGSGSCTVGSPYSISMTAVDPGNKAIRYGIDWDANGTVDQFVPSSGYVSSGTSRTASRTYATSGSKTVRILAQNEDGFASAWATVAFTCAANPDVVEPLTGDDDDSGFTATVGEYVDDEDEENGNAALVPDLSIRAIPSVVRRGRTTTVNWSATNVRSCRVSGSNGDSWTGIVSEIGGELSSPLTERTRYTLSCIGFDDETYTKRVTVHIAPIVEEL